ncbi:hypothetical protein U5B17_02175 [Campylobacter sp. 1BO]
MSRRMVASTVALMFLTCGLNGYTEMGGVARQVGKVLNIANIGA